jgi:N-acetylated-alpha-linked acidic dipeptidase
MMSFTAVLLALAAPAILADPRALVDAVNGVAESTSLSAFHELLGSEPHIAGTDGDRRQVERLATAFREMGLDVEVHRIAPYLTTPVEASLEIVRGDLPIPEGGRRGVLTLDLRERNLLEDPATEHPELTYGWNAYSGSGDVTAGVVYANYGRREDFAKLKEWGVSCQGKIVLARYGGNFRGYKAKFAEEAGAAGLIIYTDPGDTGFTKGPTWPDGGWSNDTCIQRGSLLTLPWPGDPLTPGREATTDAVREDLAALGLPHIPVQPIGYAAAERIIARMKGREVPEESWRGGVRQPYRLEGGDELLVHLVVKQERFIGETANVVATLRGATRPDEWVIVGCHHDAWGFGAADPLAGTMVLMESARAFAEAARSGIRPDRSIVFAAWGAEEFGIIGSTEWVESRRSELERGAVAYVNLDMASMGDRLGVGCSPSLQPLVEAATKLAISPFDDEPAFKAWSSSAEPKERVKLFGDLGGGSDHVGFWCHAGVPSLSLGAHGSRGNSYHSNYDTIAWYRKTVGEDYRSSLLVTRVCNAFVAACANGSLWPDDPASVIASTIRLAREAKARCGHVAIAAEVDSVIASFEALVEPGAETSRLLGEIRNAGRNDELAAQAIRAIRSAWLDDSGVPGRRWFRNTFAATDRFSGYAPAMLPLLTEAIEDGDLEAAGAAAARYRAIAERIGIALARVNQAGRVSPSQADPALDK